MRKSNLTRTFIRLARRHNIPSKQFGHVWQAYRKGGKKAVLALLGHVSAKVCQLPPSMPKSAASKIKGYYDSRSTGGMITIDLKDGLVFGDKVSTYANCANVKDAISAMRTVVAA